MSEQRWRGLESPSTQSGRRVSTTTSAELYFKLVTAEVMERKYVPPKAPADRISAGERLGVKSLQPVGRLGNLKSMLLALVGSPAIFLAIDKSDGGRTGGSLYNSFF